MALNKSLYKGKRELTMEQFQNLDVIDENTDYDIMDYPDNGMTNAQLVKTLDYDRLFKVGHITICLDDGVFRKGHILQLQVVDNVRIWNDITATSALDIEDLSKLGGLPLGAIIPIAMVTNDPYVQPLDGRNLSQTGIYAYFCTWLKNRINENVNNVPTCDIEEYAIDLDYHTQSGKFIVNDANEILTNRTERKDRCIRYQGYRLNSSGSTTAASGNSIVFIPVYDGETILVTSNTAPGHSYIYETVDYGLTFNTTYYSTLTFQTSLILTAHKGIGTKYIAINVADSNFTDGSFSVRNNNTLITVNANSIKLPTITEFVASNNGGDAIGLAELDTFKSHAHIQTASGYNYVENEVIYSNSSGAGSQSGNTVVGEYITNGTDTLYTRSDGGEETRPKNIRYPYYIVVATATKTDVQINLDNVANDINSINTILSRTEQVETIYDMNSNNPSINLGYTGGLVSTTYIIDFSKYKRIRCYFACNPANEYYNSGQAGNNNVLELDLTPHLTGQTIFTATNILPSTTTGNNIETGIALLYNTENNHFRPNQWRTDGRTVIADGTHYVYKIEGVY